MNKKIAFLTKHRDVEGLKAVLSKYSSADGLASYIEALVKESKAHALAFEDYASLKETICGFKKLKEFIDQRAINQVYGALPRLHSFIDENQSYLEQLLTKHSSDQEVIKNTDSHVSLMDNFLNCLNVGHYWKDEKFSNLVLALCIANSESEQKSINLFNESYADKLGVNPVNDVPVFGTSKIKDLSDCFFEVEKTDVKLEFAHAKIINNVGGKVGEYFVFLNFEKYYKNNESFLKPSLVGFEAYYVTVKPLEKTDVSQFKTNGVLEDVKKSFKNLVDMLSNVCNAKLPRHEVSELISRKAIYYPEFHPTTEYFVGTDGVESFKISVAAEGPVNYHTVKIRGEFKFC